MQISAQEIAIIIGAATPIYYAILRIERHMGKLAGVIESCPYCMKNRNGHAKKLEKELEV